MSVPRGVWIPALLVGAAAIAGSTRGEEASRSYGPATRLAYLQDKTITESSGIAASRRSQNLFWTHNDSGDEPLLYAFDRTGKARATFAVRGATAIDWEDLASGPGQAGPVLYVGDMGDNARKRKDCVVYRLMEPVIGSASPHDVRDTQPAERLPFRYPDGRHNAETLMVHPQSGDIYIVTKNEKPPVVYRFPRPLTPGRRVTLERVAALPGISPVLTAGDIAPEGRRFIVRDYLIAFEYRLPAGAPFASIFGRKPVACSLARERQGEAIAYRRDGQAVLTTSEGRPAPLNEMALMPP
jgi:hypothetical protein